VTKDIEDNIEKKPTRLMLPWLTSPLPMTRSCHQRLVFKRLQAIPNDTWYGPLETSW